jgi:hypothetical protein
VSVDIKVGGVKLFNGKDRHYQGPRRTKKLCSAQELEGEKCNNSCIYEKGVHIGQDQCAQGNAKPIYIELTTDLYYKTHRGLQEGDGLLPNIQGRVVFVDTDVGSVKQWNGKDLHYQGLGRIEKSCSI